MIIRIAWRNIWRNKIRTGVFVIAATLGFGVALLAANLMKSISSQRTEDAVQTQASDLQIHHKKFSQNKDVAWQIENADTLFQQLFVSPFVTSIAKRLVSNAVFASAENTVAGEIKGVVPNEEINVTRLHEFIVEGEYLAQKQQNEILISKRVAKKLDVEIGSKIIITLQDADGEIVGGAFRVKGLFATPSSPFDDRNVVVHYYDLQQLLQVLSPHEFAIKVSCFDQVETVKKHIQLICSNDLTVSSWKELLPELMAIDGFLNSVSTIFLITIVLGLGFTLLNNMNMVILERSDEIRMLHVIGMEQPKLSLVLMTEAALMMISGLFAGVIVGLILIHIASIVGIPITSDGGAMGIRPIIYPPLNIGVVAFIVLTGLIVTVLIAFIPAYRVRQLTRHYFTKKQVSV